uniref:Uncharacterized protein n=1 Tax=Tetranychus urticae TaxID=32264 RepID=T1KV11_TETUR
MVTLIALSTIVKPCYGRKPPLNGSIFGKRSSMMEKGYLDAVSMCQAFTKICSALEDRSY